MPGPRPRLHLPYAKWPAPDRLLWQRGFHNDDPFADVRLAKASQDRCMWAWRRYLGFLANTEPEALEIATAQRLTIDRVKLFITHVAESNAPNSVASIAEALCTAARVMMPNQDWTWLRTIKSRLHAAVRPQSPARPVITSARLLDCGLQLMNGNKPGADGMLGVRQAVAYRDGLLLAIVAYAPFRPKNVTSLEIGRNLIVERDRWFVIVPREETKTRKRIRFEIPNLLIPYLNFYLEVVRPELLHDASHKALWVSQWGGTLTYVGIVKSFARLSAHLGVKISPHDVRDAAVTTWAIARPDQISISRDLLYHSKLETTGLYNRVRGIEASRAYRQVICEIRKKGFKTRQLRPI